MPQKSGLEITFWQRLVLYLVGDCRKRTMTPFQSDFQKHEDRNCFSIELRNEFSNTCRQSNRDSKALKLNSLRNFSQRLSDSCTSSGESSEKWSIYGFLIRFYLEYRLLVPAASAAAFRQLNEGFSSSELLKIKFPFITCIVFVLAASVLFVSIQTDANYGSSRSFHLKLFHLNFSPASLVGTRMELEKLEQTWLKVLVKYSIAQFCAVFTRKALKLTQTAGRLLFCWNQHLDSTSIISAEVKIRY